MSGAIKKKREPNGEVPLRKPSIMGALSAGVLAATIVGAQAQRMAAFDNDYPTTVIADYVLGCMSANGQTRQILERCSCSIDLVSTILPYERYEEAEAFMSLGQMNGERGVIFRTSEEARAAIGDLRRAQVEAELRCF